MRTDEQDHLPSNKRTKLSTDQSTDATSTECVEGEGRGVSSTGPSGDMSAISRAKKPSSEQTAKATLPDMFAPEGVDPATYTATILHRLNSYIHQLRLAQAKVISRVPWSKPVAVYHRQPPHTLDYRYCQLRHRKAAITHGWPTIDLNTGQVTHPTPNAKSTSRPLSTRSSKRHVRSSCETDDSYTPLQPTPQTPVRTHHSQKHKNLSEEIHEEQQTDEPLHHTESISAAAHSTTPDPPQLSVDTHDIGPMETDFTPEDREALDSNPLSGTEIPSSSTAISPPTVDSRNQVDGSLCGEKRRDRTQEMPEYTASGVETNEVVDVRRSHKRRRTARFLDDSESDTEPVVDNCFGSSKNSTSSDVIGTKNRTVGEVVDEVPAEVNQPKSVSPYASALAAFGRGKRLKRVVLGLKNSIPLCQPEQSISRGSNDVIDLTDDIWDVPNELPANQESRGGGREDEGVPCPLCGELFTASAVEAHAASCLEGQSPSPQPQRSTSEKRHTIKQMSLLGLRLNKSVFVQMYRCVVRYSVCDCPRRTNVPLPSSHSEATEPSAGWCSGYSEEEEEDGGRGGEGTPSSEQGQ